jgi:hypothetical protein
MAAGASLSAGLCTISGALADPTENDADRQLAIEQLNQSIDRELASMTPLPPGPSLTEPAEMPTWSLESPNMPIGAARVFYKTSRLEPGHATQSIRFRIENPNVERAAIAFNVELVSERGQHYRNVVGAIVDGGRELTGPELDLVPFEPGDPIAFVRILKPMVCAEPHIAVPEVGPHQDACLPVHPAQHASN